MDQTIKIFSLFKHHQLLFFLLVFHHRYDKNSYIYDSKSSFNEFNFTKSKKIKNSLFFVGLIGKIKRTILDECLL